MAKVKVHRIDPDGGVTGNVPVIGSSGDVEWGNGASSHTFPFFRSGTLTVLAGTNRIYNDTGSALTILSVRPASVSAAPTGADLIMDIHKNGTTIFTTQANRPKITAGSTTGSKATPDVTSWADGEYLTFDVDQVGSTVPGSDIQIVLVAKE